MKLYIVVSEDDVAPVGVYTTHALAMQAEERTKFGQIHERELDKLPDEPEPRGEPDYGAPSAADHDVGREYDKYQHQEDLDAIRRQDEAEAQRERQLEERQEVREENRRLGQ